MTSSNPQTTKKQIVPLYCFKKRGGRIAPAFGVFPTRSSAAALQKVTMILQRDYRIVRARLVQP